jgi:hypothetical protein
MKTADGLTDGRTEGRTFVEATGMDEDEGGPVKNMDEERIWTDGLTDELKDEHLLRPWEWMRMKDERGALKKMDE